MKKIAFILAFAGFAFLGANAQNAPKAAPAVQSAPTVVATDGPNAAALNTNATNEKADKKDCKDKKQCEKGKSCCSGKKSTK